MKRYKLALFGVVLFYCFIIFYSATPKIPTKADPLILYSKNFSQLFHAAIKGAKKEIVLQMYALSDADIIKALEDKAQEGVSVQILFDKTAARPNLHFSEIIPDTAKGLMHRKILIIDGKLIFIGSANMTEQSLKMHDNLVVGMYKPHFELATKDGLWLLPDKNGLDALINQIHTAQKTIRVALFTLTHPQIVDALITAQNRGVSVKCAIDHYTAKGASKKQVERLRNAHIPIYLSRGLQLFHHKWAFIDNKTLILGSANWTKAAFTRNHDCFIILQNLDQTQKKFMQRIWKKIRYERERREV